ncbi:MAG: hypothetical protein AAB505_02875 [Patescibacteria group bacterium]
MATQSEDATKKRRGIKDGDRVFVKKQPENNSVFSVGANGRVDWVDPLGINAGVTLEGGYRSNTIPLGCLSRRR